MTRMPPVRVLSVLAVVLLLVTMSGQTAGQTVGLVSDCRAWIAGTGGSECDGYIAGFYDGWTTGSIYKSADPGFERFRICFPQSGLTDEQLIRVE